MWLYHLQYDCGYFSTIFNLVSKGYIELREMGYILVVLVNILYAVTIKGSGHGPADDDGDSTWPYNEPGENPDFKGTKNQWDIMYGTKDGRRPGDSLKYMVASYVTYAVIAVYGICWIYNVLANFRLKWLQELSHQEGLKKEIDKEARETGVIKSKNLLSNVNYFAFLGFAKAAIFYIAILMICFLEYEVDSAAYDNPGGGLDIGSKPDTDWSNNKDDDGIRYEWSVYVGYTIYYAVGGSVFGIWFLACLREFFRDGIKANGTHYSVAFYNAFFDLCCMKEFLMVTLMTVFAALSLKDYFYASLILVDIVNLSAKLELVLRAVTETSAQLFQVFVLMIFVAFIFTVFGHYFFGKYYVILGDDMSGDLINGSLTLEPSGNTDSTDGDVCPNLMLCFFETIDVGLRSGDIAGDAMDVVTFEDGLTYADRVLYGLLFFLVVGVILFDIVTGIIIDKFSAMREADLERDAWRAGTSFIAFIDRSAYEEQGCKFEVLENEHQKWENYVFFISHIRAKETSDHTGAETMINTKLDDGNPNWMPSGKSFELFQKEQIEKRLNAKEVTISMVQEQVDDLKLQLAQLMKETKKISKAVVAVETA